MAIDIKEEIANYLLNHCFIIGNIDSTRERYYYLINHEEVFKEMFRPLGYTIVIHRNLRVVQLINNHGTGKLELLKYESIILLILRLLYVEKRESLNTNEDLVTISVEEIQNEYFKLNLPRKLDKDLLVQTMRVLKRHNLAIPLDKLSDANSRIQILSSVMLAMPENTINDAYEKTRGFLQKYMNSKDSEEVDEI